MHKDSPEERLINLIKKKNAPRPEVEPPPVAKIAPAVSSSPQSVSRERKSFNVNWLFYWHLSLIAAMGIILFFLWDSLFWDLPWQKADLRQRVERLSPSSIKKERSSSAESIQQDFSQYASALSGKTLFSAQKITEDQTVVQTTTGSIFSKFTLVGIIAGDVPQAIIEDTQAQKTFYLQEGQSLDGILVEKIQDGKVVLSHQGEKFLLVL